MPQENYQTPIKEDNKGPYDEPPYEEKETDEEPLRKPVLNRPSIEKILSEDNK